MGDSSRTKLFFSCLGTLLVSGVGVIGSLKKPDDLIRWLLVACVMGFVLYMQIRVRRL
jgi:uncharacterized membrane protein YfcA